MLELYNFTQASPSTTWTINHNLGVKPVFDVYIVRSGIKQKALPLTATHVSNTQLVVTWTAAETGGARLAGKIAPYTLPSTSSIDPGSPSA